MRKPKWVCNDKVHFCAMDPLQSAACDTFFMGHIANFAIEMTQVLTKKMEELLQLFEGPGEVKQTSVQSSSILVLQF